VGFLLVLDGFFVILLYNQYKRLTSVPVINPETAMLAKIKSIVEVVFLGAIVLGIGLSGFWICKYLHPPITAIATSHDVNKLSPVVRLTNKAGRTYCSGVVVSPHTVITPFIAYLKM